MPIKQHDDSSQEHTGIGMAPPLDTKRMLGLAPLEGSLSSSNGYYTIVLDYKKGSPEDSYHELAARLPICRCAREKLFRYMCYYIVIFK